jgi:diguanylate cyclase (GGDEF)-like protein
MLDTTKQYYLEHFFDLSPEYQPDGAKSRNKAMELMKRALNGEAMTVEWTHCTPDSRQVPCEITFTRVLYRGKYTGLGYLYDLRHVKSMQTNIQQLESSVVQLQTDVLKVYSDALTNINNRLFFDENVKKIMKDISRANGVLSLLMIDIDHFMEYNDTYGHTEGDRCLQKIAQALTSGVSRTCDFVARYGGEEFVVVLPYTDARGAQSIAKKLHENVRQCAISRQANGAADYVTISIGVTTGVVKHTHKAADYVQCADKMLYESKRNGRNCTSFCDFTE